MEEDKEDTQAPNTSAFSNTDMEFLNFETNEDSLDLSLSGEEFNHDSLSSVPSQDSSDWTPSTYSNSNADFDVSRDI